MIKIAGNIVDVVGRNIKKGILYVENGKVINIENVETVPDQFIIPGFVDAHIHIESSMMLPTEFARMSVIHGTVACVCDPHEIANVCGVSGIDYMIENGNKSPMKFYFGAPSCVPATPFDSAGAGLNAADVETLGDLVQFNKTDLLKFRNFGKKSLTELDDLLESLNLSFGTDISKYKLDKD
jgi:adenine deaminase